MNSNKPILSRSETIDDKYTVQFFIKSGSHAETYRVKDKQGRNLFLKLFHLSKLHRTQFDGDGNIKEIIFLQSVKHPHLVTYRDSGEWIRDNQRYDYLILDFISGETLEERLKREHTLSAYEVKKIIKALLRSLDYLHNLERPIIHNDINHHNVMLDLGKNPEIPVLLDFGYARYFQSSTKVFYREGLNPFYLAPECFNNIFSAQSDLYSIGALIYHLLNGLPPWFIDVSIYHANQNQFEEILLAERIKPLRMPAFLDNDSVDPDKELLLTIAKKALHPDVDFRFKSAQEMLKFIDSKTDLEKISNQPKSNVPSHKKLKKSNEDGKGFNAIAGMDELKEILYHDVIRALEERELYEEYGLTIPNGMLLYGPPGCGKSFFAEKVAEEVGYNFIEIKPSSLASIYIHGTQEKIAVLFADARKNAPTIINFEEFDALVPNRTSNAKTHQSGEVNEFLTQLNNCGKDGIFVIASTNQPMLIDPAILRAGRIDKIIYIPPPDLKARQQMFRLLLKKRPCDLGIDYELLAKLTEDYVSIDLLNLVNESARLALRRKDKITQSILTEVINKVPPSVNKGEIDKYNVIREEIENRNVSSRPVVGFKVNR